MSQRIALVTGGTRGIGAAIAEGFKSQGHLVIVTYGSNDENAQKFSKRTGIPVRKWDVSDFEACRQGIEEITQSFGPIDILVNNAGITRDGVLHKMSSDMWGDVIRTNLTSCFNMCRAVIDSMRTRGFGRIINISSINGQKGQLGQTNYAAAKAGIIGFTKALALENASKGITVNAIAPGYIDTDMVQAIPDNILSTIVEQIPAKRLGRAHEIAHAAQFLVDDHAAYITGATLSLNGGFYFSS